MAGEPDLIVAAGSHHEWQSCPGCFMLGDGDGSHPLLGTARPDGIIHAVRTTDCPLNGTSHTWVLPVPEGWEPHPFDWKVA